MPDTEIHDQDQINPAGSPDDTLTAAQPDHVAADESVVPVETASTGESAVPVETAITGESTEKDAPAAPDRKTALPIYREAEKLFRRARKHIDADAAQKYAKASKKFKASLEAGGELDAEAFETIRQALNTALKPFRKSAGREVVESLIFALAFALVLRTFFIEPFKIPTRSMVPTLLEGDQLFVTKLSYGIRLPFLDRYVARFAQPQRGDVVVFAFPQKEAAEHLARTNSQCMRPEAVAGEKDYIKRIIGIEGDVIEVDEQVVLVNGKPIESTPFYEHTVLNGFFLEDRRQGYWNHVHHGNADFVTMTHDMPTKHFGPITVQPGHFFAMGDNRDNSLDSRCWGQVPVDNIKGRAQIIWWSSGKHGIRWNRMFQSIH